MIAIPNDHEVLDDDAVGLRRQGHLAKGKLSASPAALINAEAAVLRVRKHSLNGAIGSIDAPNDHRFVRRITSDRNDALAKKTRLQIGGDRRGRSARVGARAIEAVDEERLPDAGKLGKRRGGGDRASATSTDRRDQRDDWH